MAVSLDCRDCADNRETQSLATVLECLGHRWVNINSNEMSFENNEQINELDSKYNMNKEMDKTLSPNLLLFSLKPKALCTK